MRQIVAGFVFVSLLATGHLQAAETTVPAVAPSATVAPLPAAEKVASPAPTAAKRFHIGYIDIMKVAEQSDAGKVAKTHFEAKADRIKAQIETKQKLLEKQKTTLEAKLPTYTPEQRAVKIKEYEKKVDELRKLLQKADSEMKPLQEELLREVYGKIEKAAKEYGAANGLDAIIEKREMLYLGSNVDAEELTDVLIKALAKN